MTLQVSYDIVIIKFSQNNLYIFYHVIYTVLCQSGATYQTLYSRVIHLLFR